jgi:cytochrome P450
MENLVGIVHDRPVGAPREVPPEGGTVSGERLPEGILVNVHALTVSRSTKLWHDPDGFHPERWLNSKGSEFDMDQHDAIQPFGTGPSLCTGKQLALAEMRLILAQLVWRCRPAAC